MPLAVLVLRLPYANPQSSPTSERTRAWERTGCPLGGACPGVVAGYRLSFTGVTHDIVFNDVKKCTYLGSLTLATTLFEHRKHKLNVAQGLRGSV